MSDDLNDAIKLALGKLDAKNDDHWTENGLPRLDALGFSKQPLRAEVTAAAPLFTRANPVLEAPKVETPPAVEAPKVDQGKLDADALELLELELAEANEAVRKVEADKAEADKKVRAANAARDLLVLKLEKSGRPAHEENIMGIRAVLERSKQVREEKAGVASELRRVGVTAALLQVGSRLDQAMARKRGFGMARPNMQAAGAK